MKREFDLVGIGGTFDELHKGHRALLIKAFESSNKVLIGLSTDRFAGEIQKNHIFANYEERKKVLREFLESQGFLERSRIIPLEDPYGPTITDVDIKAIIVSEETESVAHKINRIRKQNNLPELIVLVIKMIPAEDYVSISTTRIRKGEIDKEGHLLGN